MDLDEDFVRLERRPGKVGKTDLSKSALMFQNKCFHFSYGLVACLCSYWWVGALLRVPYVAGEAGPWMGLGHKPANSVGVLRQGEGYFGFHYGGHESVAASNADGETAFGR
jgi:hypothetical protein